MQHFSHIGCRARIGVDADPIPADPRRGKPKKTPAFTPASEYLSRAPYGFAKKKPPRQTLSG
jgi:hypothetical protein